MKITIDTNKSTPVIKKHGKIMAWENIPYSERMRLLAKISEIYFSLSERIRV